MGILHNSFSKCVFFFFTSNTFPSAREKAAAEGQKTSENFTAMLCFLQSLSTAKANWKSILTVFFSLSSWLTYTVLLFPDCHLPSNCFHFLRSCWGDPAHQVCPPASDSHVHMDWEEDLIPPSPPPPFLFFSLKIFPVLELFYFSRKQRTKPPTQGASLLYQEFSIVAILPHLGHDLLAGTPAAPDPSHPLTKNTRGHLAHLWWSGEAKESQKPLLR